MVIQNTYKCIGLTIFTVVAYNVHRDIHERLPMTALFVALGIMVLALLTLLLWFVPRLLQQQVVRVSDESAQLREMLLDLLSEQEAVTIRQTQLGAAIAQLQARFDVVTPDSGDTIAMIDRMNALQQTLQQWSEQRSSGPHTNLDSSAVSESIDAVLLRLDALHVQVRDTSTIVDEGVLIGIRQLSDRVHALQLQLETWVDTLTQHHGADAQTLGSLQQQLQHLSARIDAMTYAYQAESHEMQQPQVRTTQLPADATTAQLSDALPSPVAHVLAAVSSDTDNEPTTTQLDTSHDERVTPPIGTEVSPKE